MARAVANHKREFARSLERISNSTGRRQSEVFGSFCLMAACALSLQTREPEYLQEARRWAKDDLCNFTEAMFHLTEAMQAEPFTDILGPLHMERGSKSGQRHLGEFYTPQSLSVMMARMQFTPGVMPSDRPLEVMEPACGSAGMVLALASVMQGQGVSPRCMRATCIDVNRTACDMAYINLTLWGIPAYIVHGNGLSLEQWGSWRNIFWRMARRWTGAAKDVASCSEGEAEILVLQPSGQFAFEVAA